MGDATRRSYRSKLELHIYPHIGDIPLLLLTEEDIHTLFHVTLKNKVYDPKRPRAANQQRWSAEHLEALG
ncbi:MAG: hypothetical protein JWO49_3078 [Arthrobacter sp.]|nr:hypothetical protein [Arthrobacter sp.]